MDKQNWKQLIPKDGFIKIAHVGGVPMSAADRTALIRKGNALYNSGNIEVAGKIFLTVGYTDGIIRLAQYYQEKNDFVRAFLLYRQAPDEARAQALLERMVASVRMWIDE
jgi:hypothetical protein